MYIEEGIYNARISEICVEIGLEEIAHVGSQWLQRVESSLGPWAPAKSELSNTATVVENCHSIDINFLFSLLPSENLTIVFYF